MAENIKTYLQIHPHDNVLVVLQDIPKGMAISFNNDMIVTVMDASAKHKFTMQDMREGDEIHIYSVLVGKANYHILKGSAIT